MPKLTLTDITSGYNLANQYNSNNTAIENAIENTLSRDGTAPNDMQAPLDMGGYRIVNLGAPVGPNDAVRVTDLESGSVTITPNADWPNITNVPAAVTALEEASPADDAVWVYDSSGGEWVAAGLGTGLSFDGTDLSATATGVAWNDVSSKPAFITSLASLTDPNADRILFWDDSAGALAHLTLGTGLSITSTTVSWSHLGIESLTDPNADRVLFWDDSVGSIQWLTLGTGLSISGTTVSVTGVSVAWADVTSVPALLEDIGDLVDPNNDRILFWDDSAGSVTFLAAGTNIAISNTDINFASITGSFTGTLTGVSGSVTGSLKYTKNGNSVVLEIPDLTGTSNSTAHTISGLPAAIIPATAQRVIGVTTNNGTDAFGLLVVETSGVITLHNALSATFAGTGTEGLKNITIPYHLS